MPDGYHINPTPEKPSLIQRGAEWVKSNHEEMPSLGGQLAAMWREGLKDVRQTMNEFFFGHGEHMAEAGTPLNPTQQQVTAEQGNFHGYEPIYEPSTAVIRHEQEHDHGIGH